MLFYHRTGDSEGTDFNKTGASKECDLREIFHYWYFLNTKIKFEPYACNRCHDLLMISRMLLF